MPPDRHRTVDDGWPVRPAIVRRRRVQRRDGLVVAQPDHLHLGGDPVGRADRARKRKSVCRNTVPDPRNVFGHDGWSRPDVTPTWTMMLPKRERRPRPRRGRGVSIARRLGDQLVTVRGRWAVSPTCTVRSSSGTSSRAERWDGGRAGVMATLSASPPRPGQTATSYGGPRSVRRCDPVLGEPTESSPTRSATPWVPSEIRPARLPPYGVRRVG